MVVSAVVPGGRRLRAAASFDVVVADVRRVHAERPRSIPPGALGALTAQLWAYFSVGPGGSQGPGVLSSRCWLRW